MNKTVHFVRHGQTQGNVLQYSQGPDEPLNEKGIVEATEVAERIKYINFETLIASDMLRARQTAEAIKKVTGKTPQLSALFQEVSLSDVFFGAERKEDAEALKKELFNNLDDEKWFAEHRLESYTAVHARAREALVYLKDLPSPIIVVVSHGTFLKFVLAEVLLGDTASPQQLHQFRNRVLLHNTGIVTLCYECNEEYWKVKHWNDISHFAE